MRPACYDNGWIKTNIEIYLGNQLTIKKFEKEAWASELLKNNWKKHL